MIDVKLNLAFKLQLYASWSEEPTSYDLELQLSRMIYAPTVTIPPPETFTLSIVGEESAVSLALGELNQPDALVTFTYMD